MANLMTRVCEKITFFAFKKTKAYYIRYYIYDVTKYLVN